MERWGVLIYKSVADLIVTIVQPREMNFKGRTTFIWSIFFIIHFARVKNFPFNFFPFNSFPLISFKENREKT